jgi:hypothetical protein
VSPQASAVATARAIFSPTVDDAARHLFNDQTIDRYRHTMVGREGPSPLPFAFSSSHFVVGL